ncbi:PIG-L deacetylase family protein [Paenactinomyces guangxiensis]|uniref:PIG-L family deacetylase n=1 Tax=Paenactinomyces guangxiensis TaxID=1490290 RepID=A0A7W2A8H9_9BACL|nr:PIG-L deacetylase family protein [Paenactinomyces guangxiensis]MBA4495631.1 PIG-L family deacetylase [Paenactinomyces guangxiensis]MBH8592619.1 PIG-L family deacetylase [Paenactinomyces guangxiensis]
MVSKIMYIFAHPDDETFTCGGTIAHFAGTGFTRQILYCATHGEASKTGNPPVCAPHELGNTRREELQRAARILGIDQLIIRDYGDGRLDHQPFLVLVQDIQHVLVRENPDLIITFPPSGISGHKDHKVIQQATLEAVRKTSFPTKLYYIVIPESIVHFLGRSVSAVPDRSVSLKIDVTPYRGKIADALKQHRSQHLSVEKVFPGVLQGKLDRLRTHEYYQLVLER